MSSKRGRSTASSRSKKTGKEEAEKKELPIVFEYETEDGLKISIDPTEFEVGQEIEIDENNSIELAYGFDWSPVDFNVEKKGLDLSVSGEVGVPGDLFGVSGGLILDLGKGEITGGEVGVEFGSVDIEVSVEGEKGCKKSVSIGFAGFSVSYTRDDCEDDHDDEDNTGRYSNDDELGGFNPKKLPFEIDPDCSYHLAFGGEFLVTYTRKNFGEFTDISFSCAALSASMGRGTTGDQRPSVIFTPSIASEEKKDHVFNISILTNSWTDFSGFSDEISLGNDRYTTSRITVSQRIVTGQDIINYMDLYYGYAWNGMYSYARSNFIVELRPTDPSMARPAFIGLVQLAPCPEFKTGPKSRKIPLPPPSPPPRKIMKNDCCRDSTKLMREIHQYLGIDKLKKGKGFSIPNSMMTPGGKGKTLLPTYVDINSALFKAIDAKGFNGPMVAFVKDVNKAKKGDQSVELQFNSLDAVLKNVMELLIELKGDSANRLNLQIRLAYMTTRMYRTVVKLYYIARAILDGVGTPIKSIGINLPFEFNIFAGKTYGKGFGKGGGEPTNPKLDLNDEDATESLLENLLDTIEMEISVEEAQNQHPDIREILMRKKE